jgi:hypothetical protein
MEIPINGKKEKIPLLTLMILKYNQETFLLSQEWMELINLYNGVQDLLLDTLLHSLKLMEK